MVGAWALVGGGVEGVEVKFFFADPLLVSERTVGFGTVVWPNTVLSGACNGRQPLQSPNGRSKKRPLQRPFYPNAPFG